ncbi:MAG: anti-sigma factor family protein [Candidatus Krumholzibacteriia bacterium]
MNCKSAYALIHDLIDGRLDTRGAGSLRRHTAECARCAGELRSHRSLVTLMDALPLETPPLGLADRVIAGLKAAGRIVEPAAVQRIPVPWLRTRFRVALAGAALCAVALSLFPATIRPLTGLAGKGAVALTNAFVAVEDEVARVEVLVGVADNVQKNLRTLWTVLQAGFSLVATVGEIFMLPALAFVILLTAGIAWYARALHRGSTRHASYSF